MIDKLKTRLEELSKIVLNGAEELRSAQGAVKALEKADLVHRGRADELRDIIKILSEETSSDG